MEARAVVTKAVERAAVARAAARAKVAMVGAMVEVARVVARAAVGRVAVRVEVASAEVTVEGARVVAMVVVAISLCRRYLFTGTISLLAKPRQRGFSYIRISYRSPGSGASCRPVATKEIVPRCQEIKIR